jgi:hypothetical protein
MELAPAERLAEAPPQRHHTRHSKGAEVAHAVQMISKG